MLCAQAGTEADAQDRRQAILELMEGTFSQKTGTFVFNPNSAVGQQTSAGAAEAAEKVRSSDLTRGPTFWFASGRPGLQSKEDTFPNTLTEACAHINQGWQAGSGSGHKEHVGAQTQKIAGRVSHVWGSDMRTQCSHAVPVRCRSWWCHGGRCQSGNPHLRRSPPPQKPSFPRRQAHVHHGS
jgi:hypothetical protein